MSLVRRFAATTLLAALLTPAAALLAPGTASAAHINVATIAGSINPASANHLMKVIARSESDGAVAVLIELDTPGGLLAATKDIIQAILNARVPVIVYVSPRGAWAASAGTFITMAGHVAAMAPGTSIGAAHPVAVGGGSTAPGRTRTATPSATSQPRRPRTSRRASSSPSPRSEAATRSGPWMPSATPWPSVRTRRSRRA
jgi:membrane-bound serine protease (ClpP class)